MQKYFRVYTYISSSKYTPRENDNNVDFDITFNLLIKCVFFFYQDEISKYLLFPGK